MDIVYTVTRYTKTKTVVVGSYDTEAEAKAAMMEHYHKTPKRGNFFYSIRVEKLREIDGVMFRYTDLSKRAVQYTKEMLAMS